MNRVCAGDMDEHTNVFLDAQATTDKVIMAGIAVFQYIH